MSVTGQDSGRDAALNQAAWSQVNAEYAADQARAWQASEFGWGIFNIPERELGVLGPVAGLDVVELAAARRTCRRGWSGRARGLSAWISLMLSCGPRSAARTGSASGSR
jgi:hypothetical protein